MMRRERTSMMILLASLSVALLACERRASDAVTPASAPQSATAPAPEAPSAWEALAAMDPRQPVPLQPMMAWHQKQNMQDHLVAIQQITDGLAREDWALIERASARIGSSPQMKMQCEHMGAGAPGFTPLALDFHRRADAVGEAAKARDAGAVLQATAHTLAACTSCHAAYKQDVVDAATWTQRTGSTHVPSGHGVHGGH